MEREHVEFTIKKFTPQKATKEEWTRFYFYEKEYHHENFPETEILDFEARKKVIKTRYSSSNFQFTLNLIFVEKVLAGLIEMWSVTKESSSYNEKKYEMNIRIELLKIFRQKGIGSKVLSIVVEEAKTLNKTLIITNTEQKDGKMFLKEVGFELGQVLLQNRLYFKEIDWKKMKAWTKEAELKNPDKKMFFYTKIPDEILESYAETNTNTGDQPADNLKTGKTIIKPIDIRKIESEYVLAGYTQEVAVVLNEKKKVLGFSFMVNFGKKLNYLQQYYTGVLPEQRGIKLAEWVKAGLLMHVKEKYPEKKYIVTSNAQSNAPILHINEKLGYKIYNQKYVYQIRLEALEKYLKEKQILHK